MLFEVEDEKILDASVSALRDFTTIQSLPNHTESSFLEICDAFLAQFRDLDTLLNGHYEHITTELLSAAARLQSQLLCELDTDTGTDMDLSGDTTVIALALHCFAMIHFMAGIEGYNPNIPETELFRDGSPVVVMEQEYEERRFLPTIRVHKPENYPVPRLDPEPSIKRTGERHLYLDREFHRILEHVVHVSFRLLNTQDPRHWPTVLYVLVILSVAIRDGLNPLLRWRQRLGDAKREFDLVFWDLARYYYICTGRGQILSDRWCKKEYAARVQQDRVAVEHAEMLNRLWLDLVLYTRQILTTLEGRYAARLTLIIKRVPYRTQPKEIVYRLVRACSSQNGSLSVYRTAATCEIKNSSLGPQYLVVEKADQSVKKENTERAADCCVHVEERELANQGLRTPLEQPARDLSPYSKSGMPLVMGHCASMMQAKKFCGQYTPCRTPDSYGVA
ncbi:hypothetical protein ASPVEDRAFT_74432 [Aspergillus versicolor CBS 583.65]|uniref:Uncharacterized protein n=1 Tax=Aspergillus versicolor CBS 583.65 TaxID=1036611 RepID=A0A1L9PTX8_ASPVE|nr:uncharacterized protein ASPVEDRAFT_74432 [Aspergillus versicolor CBS 583.65]OJJ04988.1 hypothetical protein ASPVEDRAFT_74432 [Aspergillus versicolor CBS 583.65]